MLLPASLVAGQPQRERSLQADALQRELDRCWERLADADSQPAEEAAGKLIDRGDAAVAFLDRRLRPLIAPKPGQIRRLIDLLDADEFAVRSRAFGELAELDGAVEPALRRAMSQGPSAEVGHSIRRLLAAMEFRFTVQPQHYRLARAAEVLQAIDSQASRRLHRTLLQARPRKIVPRQMLGLARALVSDDLSACAEAARALGEMGPKAEPLCEQLVDCLRKNDNKVTVGPWTSAVSGHAERALEKIGKPAVPALIDGLKAGDNEIRKRSAGVLGRLKDPRSIDALIAMLHNEDRSIRGSASSALKHFGPAAAEALVGVLQGPNLNLHVHAAYALQGCADEKSVGPLIAALGHEQKEVRKYACQALWRIGRPVVGPLIESLDNDDPNVRLGAADALGKIHDPRALGPLLAKLTDPEAAVREEVADSLTSLVNAKVTDPSVAERLTAALQDPSARVRRQIAMTLGSFPFYKVEAPRPVDQMIGLLDDPNVSVRLTALETLGTFGDRRAVEPILAKLEVAELQSAAARALGVIGDGRAVGPLRKLLPQKNPAAIRALAALHDRDSVEKIIPLLRDGKVRKVAAEALGDLEDTRAVEPLIAALQESFEEKRDSNTDNLHRTLAAALGNLGDPRAVEPMLELLRRWAMFDRADRWRRTNETDCCQLAISWPLMRLGKPAVGPLAKALDDPNEEVRGTAVWVFEQWVSQGGLDGDDIRPGIEPLAGLLDDRNLAIRAYAALTLGRIGDPRAVEPLTELLGRDDPSDLVNAAACLSKYRDPESVALVRRKLNDPQAKVRADAAKALGWMKDPTVAEGLLAALGDDSPEVRARAARALGLLGCGRAVDPLIRLLKDPQAEPRRQAADALGRIGDAKAVEPVAALIAEKDFEVRVAAGKALCRLNDPRGPQMLSAALNDPARDVRHHTALQLGFYDSPQASMLEPLAAALGSEKDGDIRCNLVWALGRIDDRRVVDPLIAALDDHFGGVQYAAAEVLIGINDPRAVQPVLELLENESTPGRKHIAYKLRKIHDPRVVKGLLKLLDDADIKVRIAAIGSLGSLRAESAVDPLIAALADRSQPLCKAAAEALKRITGKQFKLDQKHWQQWRSQNKPPQPHRGN